MYEHNKNGTGADGGAVVGRVAVAAWASVVVVEEATSVVPVDPARRK